MFVNKNDACFKSFEASRISPYNLNSPKDSIKKGELVPTSVHTPVDFDHDYNTFYQSRSMVPSSQRKI
jgi:hypothetical protein